VVNVFGGFGPSASKGYARVMQQLATLCNAHPVFLHGPGVVASTTLRDALRREPQVLDVVSFYDRLTVLLVGIGALPRPHRDSWYVGHEDQAELRSKGAVGDIALHFFDAEGGPVQSSLEDRVLGISRKQLEHTPRIIAVAGGESKFEAIRAALRGRWVDSLVTDLETAQELLRRP